MRCVGELRMTIVDYFIKYLINEYKVLADSLLVDHTTEIFNDDDNAIE